MSSKYSNIPTSLDGYNFDSQAEANRFAELQLLQRAGEIHSLAVHPTYQLQEPFRHQGKAIEAITYEGDFEYTENGQIVCEDVKGVQTEVFRIKKKLMARTHPEIELRIVKVKGS